MIDLKTAWPLVHSKAKELHRTHAAFTNKREGKTYRIYSVSEKIIVVEADGENKPFGELALTNQIKKLNNAGGKISYHDFFGNVAKETAVVSLHPQLDWANDRKDVIDLKA